MTGSEAVAQAGGMIVDGRSIPNGSYLSLKMCFVNFSCLVAQTFLNAQII